MNWWATFEVTPGYKGLTKSTDGQIVCPRGQICRGYEGEIYHRVCSSVEEAGGGRRVSVLGSFRRKLIFVGERGCRIFITGFEVDGYRGWFEV